MEGFSIAKANLTNNPKPTTKNPKNPLLLLKLLEQGSDANLILYDTLEVGDVDALLLHGVTVTQGHGVVFESLMIHGDAERSADSILTAVTLAYLVFLFVFAVEMELERILYLAGFLGQSVLLSEREDGELDGRKGGWEMKHGA